MMGEYMAAVKTATACLDSFLDQYHTGGALDRPVMEYLAGAIADAAEEAGSFAAAEAAAPMVAELVAEYLQPPTQPAELFHDMSYLIWAVKAGREPLPQQQRQQPAAALALQQEQEQEPGFAAGLSVGAAEFVPRASAAPFVPGSTSSSPAGTSQEAAAGEYTGEGDWEGSGGNSEGHGYYYGEEGLEAGGLHDWSAWHADLTATMTEEEALEALTMHFPHYSMEVLGDMLAAHGGDASLAADVLRQFEMEIGPLAWGQQQLPEESVGEEEPPVIDDEEVFPTLGSASGGSSGGGTAAGSWGPAVDFAGALRRQAPPSAPPSQQQRDTVVIGARGGSSGQQRALVPASSSHRGTNSAVVRWVATGAAVDSMYKDARAEARDQARIRNAYFQQATQAYLAGNRALAKELGAKGREAGDAMKAAHERASQEIYQSRNQLGLRSDDSMIDLHGLHTTEAVRILGREIARLKQQGQHQVYVLVGTGHHTTTHKSTLPAAVEGFLKEKMISFRVSQPGLLELRLL
mmetsp:Transcript_30071/g.84875  ORF Transcript_30071/g.84875 Transcript_30071/m.84875 type:complete len:520 (-) Transcript_30071:333-1892(-)